MQDIPFPGNETLRILFRARERLARGWCKGYLALDEAGHACEPDSPVARQWCLLGALGRDEPGYSQSYWKVQREIGEVWLTLFNNRESTAHADVMGVIDRVIVKEIALHPVV